MSLIVISYGKRQVMTVA